MKNSTKKFIKQPEYPGGKTAFKEYIKKSLIYPEEALEKKIEGIVHLSAQIDDNGTVDEVVVEKGIGYGCDEEAVRLIKNIRYGAVKNKGVRLKTRQHFRIEFNWRQKRQDIRYQFKKSSSEKKKVGNKKPEEKYSYFINIKHKEQ
jgi:TonB family protein